MKVEKKNTTLFVIMIIVCLLCRILTVIGFSNEYNFIMDIFVLIVGSVILILFCKNNTDNKVEFYLILLGFSARIILMFLDIKAPQVISFLHSRADADPFYATALDYYNGETVYYTTYPIIISILFHIVGCNRILIQFINIICSITTVIVFIKMCRLSNVQLKYRIIGEFIILFQPNYMSITSFLMRESIITLCVTLSFYYFMKWFHNRKEIELLISVLLVLASVYLHTATIVILIAYFIFVIYCNKSQIHRIKIGSKTLATLLALLIILVIIWNIDPMRNQIIWYSTRMFNLLEFIQSKQYDIGNSDYLKTMHTENYIQLIVNTIIRMIYFVFSPMPWDWRGIKDVVAVLMNSLLFFIILIIDLVAIGTVKKSSKNNEKYFLTIISVLIIFGLASALFAWGVNNSGQAIRHRDKLIGLMAFSISYSLQIINKIKGRK